MILHGAVSMHHEEEGVDKLMSEILIKGNNYKETPVSVL